MTSYAAPYLKASYFVPVKFKYVQLYTTYIITNFKIYIGGHLGRDKTYEKIAERFHWKLLWKHVTDYVRTCAVCQTTNVENL